jgi:ascorbate-specific PTS system EIIC-type component UlaA
LRYFFLEQEARRIFVGVVKIIGYIQLNSNSTPITANCKIYTETFDKGHKVSVPGLSNAISQASSIQHAIRGAVLRHSHGWTTFGGIFSDR